MFLEGFYGDSDKMQFLSQWGIILVMARTIQMLHKVKSWQGICVVSLICSLSDIFMFFMLMLWSHIMQDSQRGSKSNSFGDT